MPKRDVAAPVETNATTVTAAHAARAKLASAWARRNHAVAVLRISEFGTVINHPICGLGLMLQWCITHRSRMNALARSAAACAQGRLKSARVQIGSG